MSVARMMQMAAAGSAGAGPEPSGWTDPDLANASYDSVSFSVAGQDSTPSSVVFKPDGLKMYVAGSTTDNIYQYSLSSAWDVSTTSYDNVSFSVSSQAGQPYLQFGDDGAKLYVSDNTSDTIYQYSLSTAWDISSASYDSVSFSTSSQDTVPQGIFIKPDGTKLYLVGFGNDTVFQYSMSTAWDLSSIAYDSVSFSFLSQETQGRSVFFSPEGTKMYIVGTDSDTVYQYTLSTAWDVSSASYDSVSFSVSSQETVPLGLTFKSDGSKMYVVGSGNDTIYQYSTAAAAPAEWTDPDLGNASYDSVSFSGATQSSSMNTFTFGNSGSNIYMADVSSDTVYQYDLTTPYDISTASYSTNSFSVATQEGFPAGIYFKPDGQTMFLGGYSSDTIYQYTLSTAWDISTATYASKSLSVAAQESTPRNIWVNNDGTKLFVVGQTGDDVNQYDFSTPWDISTASYTQNFSVAAQDTTPIGLYFSPTGDKMFIAGSAGDAVYQYGLSTALDVSTASYDSVNFSVSAQTSAPVGVVFNSAGSKMYVLSATNDTIYQYSTSTAAPAEWTDPDLANASYDSVSFSVAGEDSTPVGVSFSNDGTKMFLMGLSTDSVYQYTLSTAWDVSSASYDSVSFSITQFATQYNISFKYDGTEMYVVGASVVGQYALSTAWDLSSASHSYTLDISAQTSFGLGAFVSHDGNNLYIAEASSDSILQYSLSTAYDLSSASYVQSLSVGSQETIPRMVFLSPDGFSLFLIGNGGDEVNEYSLTTAWDISTASHVQFFSVIAQAANALGFTFKVDGSKMYVVDQAAQSIYQYSTA